VFAVQTADGHSAKAQVKSISGDLSRDYITYAYTFQAIFSAPRRTLPSGSQRNVVAASANASAV
jgi:hypothetical protein